MSPWWIVGTLLVAATAGLLGWLSVVHPPPQREPESPAAGRPSHSGRPLSAAELATRALFDPELQAPGLDLEAGVPRTGPTAKPR